MTGDTVVIDGTCNLVNHLDGSVDKVIMFIEPLPIYDGEYVFTPTSQTQIIEIEGKKASSDITINPIPSNYGLVTRVGSNLMIS